MKSKYEVNKPEPVPPLPYPKLMRNGFGTAVLMSSDGCGVCVYSSNAFHHLVETSIAWIMEHFSDLPAGERITLEN